MILDRLKARLREFAILFWAIFMVTGFVAVAVKFWLWFFIF